jgi:tetratricopeptide (TPR) repeat protein
VKPIPLVGIAMVTVLVGAPAIRAVTAQGKGQDQSRQALARYEEGRRAYAQKRFEDAVNLMNAAIKLDDKERMEGRFGGGDDYFPYFYLGQALRELDRCARALDAWEESHRQQVASRRAGQSSAIQDGYRYCEAKGFLLGRELRDAYDLLDKTLSVAEVALNPLLLRIEGLTPDLQERLRRAQIELAQLRPRLRIVFDSRVKKEFDDAQRRADESQRALNSIESDAKRKPAPPPPSGEKAGGSENEGKANPPLPPIPKELVDKVDRALKNADRGLAEAKTALGKLGPEAAAAHADDLNAVETGLVDWRRDLKAASDPPDLEKYQIAAEMPPAVRGALNRLRSLLPGAPAPLSEAFQTGAALFFTGRYEQAVAALTDDLAAQVPDAVRPDFYAFRAAANFALYERSGRAIERESESRKIMAIDDVRRCKTLKSDFRPDQSTFSPRFIEFFESIPK